MQALAMQLQTNESNGMTMFWKKGKRSSLFRWRNIEQANVFLIKNISLCFRYLNNLKSKMCIIYVLLYFKNRWKK